MRTRTHLATLAALGLFLAALVIPRETVDEFVELPLDFTGINEVQVSSDRRVAVEISLAASPQIRYRNARDVSVTSRREGNRLYIESDHPGYMDVSIRIPATVRRLVVTEANVTSRAALETLVIEASEGLSWSGDIGSLVVLDTRPPPPEAAEVAEPESPAAEAAAAASASARGCRPSCGSDISISGGTIAELQVTTRNGNVGLDQSDRVGKATLVLGPSARFSISRASRLPELTLLPLEGGADEPTEIAP